MNLGGISFVNTSALWGLLGIPALVAIHFFQQRSRRLEISTRFLIDALAPESRGGRTWERFRSSRVFWLQVLATMLVIWVLAEPRWPRADSTQTVVLVLDDAVAMRARVDEARAATLALMNEAVRGASKTEWVLMTSDPRRPALYRGPDRRSVEVALAAWRPALGTHDYLPALRLGRGLAGAGGMCWFVTDRESKVPEDQAAVGVGRPLNNVGFAGGEVRRDEKGDRTWRAVLKNSSSETQRREWWIETAAGASERREVELAPDAVVELGGVWPSEAERATLRLVADGFVADDSLPLIRPEPKSLAARVGVTGETGAYFKKILEGIDGVKVVSTVQAGLRIVEEDGNWATPPGAAVVLAAKKVAEDGQEEKARTLARAPVVAERHALVDGLNWQGLLGPGPADLKMTTADEGLLWQADAPLVWLRPGAEGTRQLVLNLDWMAGNAGRLSATVLLLRRYIETVRDAQTGVYSANFDADGRVNIAEQDRTGGEAVGPWSIAEADGTRRVIETAELVVLRAPVESGFFNVQRGEEVLVSGASQFADARQGDFRGAGSFRREPPAGAAAALRARNTQGDPLAAVWLALAGVMMVWSWWPDRERIAVAPSRETRRRFA